MRERGRAMTKVKYQLVTFELEIDAIDEVTRRRWNGEPMASKEASDALFRAKEAAQESLRRDGFLITTTNYGVSAERVDAGQQDAIREEVARRARERKPEKEADLAEGAGQNEETR